MSRWIAVFVKLLIIAGPHEADRIRRAAVLAGLEAVAIEPGESLSGWITATRPDVIILAPHIVSGDPVEALAKVRAVPRGRVPVLLVGDAEHEVELDGLADGVFVRPIVAADLLARAHEIGEARAARFEDDAAGEPPAHRGTSAAPGLAEDRVAAKTPTLRPLVAVRGAGIAAVDGRRRVFADPPLGTAVPKPGKTSERWPPPPSASGTLTSASPAAALISRPATLFDTLAESIEADLDAELLEVARTVGAMRRARPSVSAGAGFLVGDLRDESSQKTLEMPSGLTAALNQGGRQPVASAAIEPGVPSAPRPARLGDGDAARVLACHRLVMEGNYFQILGVTPQATAAEIERACAAVTAELSPPILDPKVAAHWDAELNEIRAVVAEAGRLLGDERLRRQYREALAANVAGADSAP